MIRHAAYPQEFCYFYQISYHTGYVGNIIKHISSTCDDRLVEKFKLSEPPQKPRRSENLGYHLIAPGLTKQFRKTNFLERRIILMLNTLINMEVKIVGNYTSRNSPILIMKLNGLRQPIQLIVES